MIKDKGINRLLKWFVSFLIGACISSFVLATEGADPRNVHLIFAFQNIDNYPYQVGNGTQVNRLKPGLAVEQMQEMAKRLNLDLELIRVPWKRGLQMLKRGEIEGLFNASYKPERKQYGRYPFTGNKADAALRSYSNSYSLFIHKDSGLKWDGHRFNRKNIRVFAPLGFSVADDLRKLGAIVNESSEILSFMPLLSKQRIDALALFTPAGKAYLQNHADELKEVSFIAEPIVSKDYYLMLSHQFAETYPSLAERIWKTVAEVREDRAYIQRFAAY